MPIRIIDVKHELWRRGDLSWMVRPYQWEAYQLNKASWGGGISVVECTRKFGKTLLGLIDDAEFCIQRPNSVLASVGPIYKEMELILTYLLGIVFSGCPADMRPTMRGTAIIFPAPINSRIQIAGTDNKHYEYLRGPTYHKARVDEAGFCDDLDLIVKDIFLPAMMRTGGGVTMMSSTPRTPDHKFIDFADVAKGNKRYIMRTIDEITDLSDKQKSDTIREMGGMDSLAVKRELYCERVVDESIVVFPEFTREKQAEIVKRVKRPEYYRPCAGIDPGFSDRDWFAIVWGYYDFDRDVTVLSDCLIIKKPPHSQHIVERAKVIEAKSFGKRKIYSKSEITRYSDHYLSTVVDFNNLHDYRVTLADKKFTEDDDAGLNLLAVMIRRSKIEFDMDGENMDQLVAQFVACRKNKRRTDLEHTDAFGHFDGVSAAKYLVRSIDKSNPHPPQAWRPYDPEPKNEHPLHALRGLK